LKGLVRDLQREQQPALTLAEIRADLDDALRETLRTSGFTFASCSASALIMSCSSSFVSSSASRASSAVRCSSARASWTSASSSCCLFFARSEARRIRPSSSRARHASARRPEQLVEEHSVCLAERRAAETGDAHIDRPGLVLVNVCDRGECVGQHVRCDALGELVTHGTATRVLDRAAEHPTAPPIAMAKGPTNEPGSAPTSAPIPMRRKGRSSRRYCFVAISPVDRRSMTTDSYTVIVPSAWSSLSARTVYLRRRDYDSGIPECETLRAIFGSRARFAPQAAMA
jgi:hypothetical protein